MSAFFAVTYKVRKAHSVPIIENCPFSLYNSDPFTCSDPFLTTTKTFSVNLINCIVFDDQIPVASAKNICLFRQRHSASFQYVLMPLSSVMIVSHKYPPKYVCSFIAHTNIQNIVFFRIVKVSPNIFYANYGTKTQSAAILSYPIPGQSQNNAASGQDEKSSTSSASLTR